MFREMRRIRQKMPLEECREVLVRGSSGVLALHGEDGYPYAVPLSYVYAENSLWFHCAQSGHKLDALRKDGKASFCVIDKDEVIPEKYTTAYRSVIVFGTVRIVEDATQERAALEALALKYAPNVTEEKRLHMMEKERDLFLLEFHIEHMSGKEGRELARRRELGEA